MVSMMAVEGKFKIIALDIFCIINVVVLLFH